MQCPADSSTLLMAERRGVEIDYCPQCRGVWLDRGELDKLIERSDDADDRPRGDQRRPDDDRRPGEARTSPPKRKKWLSEMFEFD